jgi:hypothetical protein
MPKEGDFFPAPAPKELELKWMKHYIDTKESVYLHLQFLLSPIVSIMGSFGHEGLARHKLTRVMKMRKPRDE